jgi:hypothetical protein
MYLVESSSRSEPKIFPVSAAPRGRQVLDRLMAFVARPENAECRVLEVKSFGIMPLAHATTFDAKLVMADYDPEVRVTYTFLDSDEAYQLSFDELTHMLETNWRNDPEYANYAHAASLCFDGVLTCKMLFNGEYVFFPNFRTDY